MNNNFPIATPPLDLELFANGFAGRQSKAGRLYDLFNRWYTTQI